MKAFRNHRQAEDEFLATTPEQETWRVFRIVNAEWETTRASMARIT